MAKKQKQKQKKQSGEDINVRIEQEISPVKEKDKGKHTDNPEVDAHTVFIRNLPFSIDDTQLQEVFSEIGPVRRSFTIKQKGSEQHKGFGFVQFAVAEDAVRAVQEKNGTDLQGRKIMVTVAKRRPSLEDRKSKKGLDNSKGDMDRKSKEEAPETKNETEKNVKNRGQNDKNESSVISQVNGKRKRDDSEVAKEKVKKKKNTKPQENKSSEKQRVARTVVFGGLVNPDMREQVIECAKKAGMVESVQSSLAAQELKGRGLEKDGCKMGAAAIIYTSVRSASKAVASLHGKIIGGGTVWARQLGGEGSKPRKWRVIIRNLPFKITEQKIREMFSSVGFIWEIKIPLKEDRQAKGFAFASFTSKADAEQAIQTMNGKRVDKRPIAVDWAVERKAYQESVKQEEHTDSDTEKLPSDIEDVETASGDDEDFDLELQHDREGDGENGSGDDEDIDITRKVLDKVVSMSQELNTKSNNCDLENVKKEDTASLEKELSTREKHLEPASEDELKRTVFVRNLPFDVSSDALKKHFSEFGKIDSVFLVLHPKTKRPRGTAFIKFSMADGADAALAAPSAKPGGLLLGGRQLSVLSALEKETAKAKEKEKLESSTEDRRNLYLIKEGKIEGTPAAEGVSEEDMQKRRELDQVKAVKLRSPNFHVSKTRLAVYNIPKSMKEAEIKKLFIDAIKSRATKQNPVIKEVVILKDEEKGGKSRGVAFVEFTEHEHALVALRVLNNNPETFGRERRPIVGFAIENVHKVRMRNKNHVARNDENNSKAKKFLKNDRTKGNVKNGRNQEEPDHEPPITGKERKKLGKKRKQLSDKSVNGSTDSEEEKIPSSMPHSKKQKRSRKDSGNDQVVNSHTTPVHKQKSKVKQRNDAQNSNEGTNIPSVKGKPDASNGPKVQKSVKKKKNSKPEIEDKLDKLVAAYRDRCFSGATVNSKGIHSTNERTANDLKRWFE